LNKDRIPSLDLGRVCMVKSVRTSVMVACTVEKVVLRSAWPFPFAFEKAAEIEVTECLERRAFFAE
jgi:hypothetical protein